MQNTRLTGVKKIAVLRANAVGDFLFALPALEALRHAYPDAAIVLLGRQWHRDFLAGRPGPVDRVEVVPRWAGVSDEDGGGPDFFDRMRRERFDLALQMHGGGRNSNPFVLQLGARVTAGLKTADAVALDRWVPYVYFQPEVLRYLEVASLAGAPPVTLEPRVVLMASDHTAIDPPPGELVLLNPHAGDGRRCWPLVNFARVGDALAAQGYTVLVQGAAAERCTVDQVLEQMESGAAIPIIGLPLGALAALQSRCRLVISNDSGPLHLASAVGTPAVGIYWCGNLFTAGPATRRAHRPCISWRLNCPQCGRNCIEDSCSHHASFVADIPVAEVLANAEALLTLYSLEK